MNPILRHSLVPQRRAKLASFSTVVAQQKLHLAPLVQADARRLLQLIDDGICRQMNIEPVKSLEHAKDLVRAQCSSQTTRLGIWHQEYGLVGSTGYGHCDEQNIRTASIYYWLGAQYQRRRLGSQVLRLLLPLVKQQFKEITADVYEDNRASIRLLEKAGFVRRSQLMQAGDRRIMHYYLPTKP